MREKVIDASNELKVGLSITTDGAVQPAAASKRKQDGKPDGFLKVSDPPIASSSAAQPEANVSSSSAAQPAGQLSTISAVLRWLSTLTESKISLN